MNLETCIWSEETYHTFQKQLYDLQDLKYKKFHGKLIQDDSILIGVRTPQLKEIAKKISKNHPMEFLKYIKHDTYEETLIHGLLLGYMKIEFHELIRLLDSYFPYMNNWALNDITCANLKIWKKHLKEGLSVIVSYLEHSNLWIRRFGLVLLLDFYVNDDYINYILKRIVTISGDEYYVGLANAWLISVCYVRYPNKTKKLLESKKLDDFTQKHAIQKILGSTRVPKEEKNAIRLLRNT